MSDEYTEDELQTLPQTDQVFDLPTIDLNKHDLVQEGYTVIDRCPSHPTTSFSIPSGKTLIKQKGEYKLIDERVR